MASTDITLIGLDEATLSDDLVTVLADPSTNGGYKASVGDLADYIIANAGLDYTDTATNGTYVKAVSESDGVISVTRETADTTPTEDSTKLITSGGVESALSMDLTSVSGNPITISDASNTNCETLVATISPTQAGTGDPSPTNARPISGVSTLKVYHAGKNLCFMPTFSSAFGWAVQPTNRTDIIALLNNLPSGTYTISVTFKLVSRNDTSDGSTYGISFSGVASATRNEWGTLGVGGTATITTTVTISETTNCTNTYFYGCGIDGVGATGTARVTEFQIEQGSTATTYEPYQGTSITLSLGSTVYGGSVDLSSGVLTVDKVMVDLGDFDWNYISADNVFYNVMPTTCDYNAGSTDTLCSGFAYDTDATWYNYLGENQYMMCKDLYSLNRVSIAVKNTSVSTAEDFKTLVTGMKFVYPLATPTTTQLTPQTLRLLQGNNTLWTNAEGLEVEYQPNNFVGQLKAWILDQLS